VSIIAPGESIISASYTADGDYAVMSGTSMATPHVVGVVAQLLQAQPRLNQVQVLRLLTASGIADSLSGIPAATTNLLLHSSPSGCGLFASDGGCAGAVIPQAPPPQDGAIDGITASPTRPADIARVPTDIMNRAFSDLSSEALPVAPWGPSLGLFLSLSLLAARVAEFA